MIKGVMPLMVFLLISSSASAQTPQEISTTCATLARLTERALPAGNRSAVLLYVHTAQAIRKEMGTTSGCEAGYFARVVERNRDTFDGTASVIALTFVQPAPGWKHHEIQELIRATQKDGLSSVLETLPDGIQLRDPQKELQRELERGGVNPRD